MGKKIMMNQNVRDLKTKIQLGEIDYNLIEVFAYFSSVAENQSIHTDRIRSVDFSFDVLPWYMPIEWYVMDEEEYEHTIDANTCHIPFSDYIDGENPQVLVVMLPHDYKDYLKYVLYRQPSVAPGVPCPCGPGASINWDQAEQIAIGSKSHIHELLVGRSVESLGEVGLLGTEQFHIALDKLVNCERDITALMNVGDVDYFMFPYYYILRNQTYCLRLKETRGIEDYPML